MRGMDASLLLTIEVFLLAVRLLYLRWWKREINGEISEAEINGN